MQSLSQEQAVRRGSVSVSPTKSKITHVYYGDQNGEEAKNVDDKDHGFNLRQYARDDGVDQDRDDDHSPEYQRHLPSLEFVSGVVQSREGCYLLSAKETAPCQDGHPPRNDEPTCDVCDKRPYRWRCQHGDPVILTCSGRCPLLRQQALNTNLDFIGRT